MRKSFLFFGLAILCIVIAAALTWTNRENILAHFLSRQLRVPVSIRSLNLSKSSAEILRLRIGNFPHSQTPTSFTAETVKLNAKLEQIFENPLIIEQIDIDNIFVGIEYYDADGNDNNWRRILHEKTKKKKTQKDYLIRTLILRNLTVELTKKDGTTKRYPTIKQMEFHNISSETGFPIEEIEKAIFNLMMQDLLKKLQIDQLFKKISPWPIPFFPQNSSFDSHFYKDFFISKFLI